MNFIEYLESDGSKRQYNVEITPEDCVTFTKNTGNPNHEFYIVLNIEGEFYQYVVIKDTKILRTIDINGNPKGYSCFVLKKIQNRKKLVNPEKDFDKMVDQYITKQQSCSALQKMATINYREIIYN